MNNGVDHIASKQLELRTWISDWIRKELRLGSAEISPAKTFVTLGMDSVLATMLAGDLEELLGVRLPPTLAWDHPTVDALSLHLSQISGTRQIIRSEANEELLSRLDSLSEEEIERLLEERLGRV